MGQCADLQLNLSILQPRFGVVTMVPITNQSAPPKSSPPSSASPINTQCSTGRHRQHLTFLPHFLTHCTGCVHSCCSKPQPTNLWSVPAPLHPKCYLTGSGRILAYQSLMKKLSAPAQIWRTSAREASPPNSTSNTSLSIELPYPGLRVTALFAKWVDLAIGGALVVEGLISTGPTTSYFLTDSCLV